MVLITDAASFWPSDTAGKIADAASVIGLSITVYVAALARNIRREVQRLARLPEILDGLEALAVSFSRHFAPGSDHAERSELIGRAEGLLNSLMSYSDKGGLASIAIVSRKITACKGQAPRLSDLIEMHGELYRLIEEIRDQVRRG